MQEFRSLVLSVFPGLCLASWGVGGLCDNVSDSSGRPFNLAGAGCIYCPVPTCSRSNHRLPVLLGSSYVAMGDRELMRWGSSLVLDGRRATQSLARVACTTESIQSSSHLSLAYPVHPLETIWQHCTGCNTTLSLDICYLPH